MIGNTIAHFKITGKLGEGGMGEVYRAEDTKLGREVALKVLPAAFAQDHERMIRFAREAQVLASLNHTNIAAIYGVEEDGDRHALIMELVEGETLQERIARGGLSLEESARLGLEIAQAIEVAHDKGIVHRDLKPANIKVTPTGQVKVLDFGLAKALEEEPNPADIANSPTLTAAATQAGIIMGTAAYMSPEQAAGSVADRRADIWSYGVVLCELLTGRRQFGGETVSHTLASVLKDEPDWDRLPGHVPPRVVDLLKRCLRKDPRQRLQAIGEARVLWEEYLTDPESFQLAPETAAVGTVGIPMWKRMLPWAIAAVLAAGLGFVALQWSNLANQPRSLLRTTILPPEGHKWYLDGTYPGRVAISPDGRQLAFSALAEEDGDLRLWIRPLDSPVGRPLQDSEGAAYPFWSPDGRYVAFFAEGKLKKIAVSGGPSVSLCGAPFGKSGSWSRSGTIIFAPGANSGLSRVPAAGGECVPVTELNKEAGESSHRHPWFLPDDNHFLYLARLSGLNRDHSLRIGSLDGETDRDLLVTPSNAAFASGRLLFMRESTLMAQPFDPQRLELTGEAVPLVEEVLQVGSAALSVFTVSETGELVYQTGQSTQNSQLSWRDRSGATTGHLGEPAHHLSMRMSGDGSKVSAAIRMDEDNQRDIWIYDTERGVRTRATFDPADDTGGAWSASGDRYAFSSNRADAHWGLYLAEVGGTGEALPLLVGDNSRFPGAFTPDDEMLLYTEFRDGGGSDLFALPLTGDRKPIQLTETEFRESSPSVSPDGRWLLYSSNESGRREIYVTTYPAPQRKWQISANGGTQGQWTRDGTEIIYHSFVDSSLNAVEVRGTASTFEVGADRKLFDVDLRQTLGTAWQVTTDGQRFLINEPPETSEVSVLHLAANWPAILEDR